MAKEQTKYLEGKCFICQKDCDKDAYVHKECAEAWFHYRQEELKEMRKKFPYVSKKEEKLCKSE